MGIFSGPSPTRAVQGAQQTVRMGQDSANAYLDEGYNRASDQFGKAAGVFGGMAASYAPGATMYQDALGLNGQAGSDTARSTFTTSPGYTFNLDQGLQGLSRARAVNGTVASGNADTDAMKFASGLASGEWNGWLDRLSGLDTKRATALTGEAATFGTLGNLAGNVGNAKATTAFNSGVANANTVMQGYQDQRQNSQQELGGWLGLANLGGQALGSLAGNGNAIGNIGRNLSSAFSIFGGA